MICCERRPAMAADPVIIDPGAEWWCEGSDEDEWCGKPIEEELDG